MNIKKLVSVVVASAIMVMSASSLATSVAAYNDPALMTLKEYNANAELKGYTADELEAFPLKTLLDSMTYAEDVYEETPEQEDSGASSDTESSEPACSESGDSSDTENSEPANSESSDFSAVESETSSSVEITSSDTTAPPAEETEPAVQAAAELVKLHSKGDKVVFPAGAKYVWVGDEEYSIYDENATVNLYLLGNFSHENYYTFNRDIIVGSGKQLDPDNVIYHVNIAVYMYWLDIGGGIKFYYESDGKKNYVEAKDERYSFYRYKTNSDASYTYENNLTYSCNIYEKILGDSRYTGLKIEPDFQLMLNDEPVAATNMTVTMQSFGSSGGYYSYRFNVQYTLTNGELYEEKIYISIYQRILGVTWEAVRDGNVIKYYGNDGDYWYSEFLTHESHLQIAFREIGDEFRTPELKANKTGKDLLAGSIIKAVVGEFESLQEAASEENISDKIFGNGIHIPDLNSRTVTVFIKPEDMPELAASNEDAVIVHFNLSGGKGGGDDIETGTIDDLGPDLTNEFFRLQGISGENAIILDESYDSYYKLHYQTAIIYGNSDADTSAIKLNVSSPDGVTVANSETGAAVKFDEEPQDFSSEKAIQYSVAASGGQGNYFVNVVKAGQEGAKLFVNGPDEREVFFDSIYGNYHDILLANLGSDDVTGLSVELRNTQNIKLNDFWRLDGSSNSSTLKPFSTGSNNKAGLAKIRLQPNGEGEVSGELVIYVGGKAVWTITLKGFAGDPDIVTVSPLTDAVKYVPYSAVVSTNNVHPWIKTTFAINGSLPNGLTFDSNSGEIYGTPLVSGTFYLYIYASFGYRKDASGEVENYQVSKNFTLNILDNTNTNVRTATDSNYDLLDAVGTLQSDMGYTITPTALNSDQIFRSNGEFAEFIDFWLNGARLIKDVDYTAESGSTKITIKSQTLSKLAENSTNTIAAEFRVDGDLNKELKRTAQNFTIGKPANPNNPDNPNTPNYPSSSGSSGSIGDSDNSGNSGTTTSENKEIVFTPENPDDAFKGAQVTAHAGTLPENAKLIIKLDTSIPADKGIGFDITFTLDGKEIQPTGNVLVKLPIPKELKGKTIYVYHIEDGKYVSVDFRIEGDFVCFYANHFSTYVISGKKLDSNGSEITTDAPGTSQNPITGIGISAAGLVLSAAVLTVVLTVKKKKR